MVKAIYDRQTLDLPLAGPIYKQLLAPDPMTSELSPRDLSPRDLSPRAVLDAAANEEDEVSLDELERLDAGFARSLRWILENDPAPLCETFSTTRRVLTPPRAREGDGADTGGVLRVERLSADDLLALPPELRVVDEVVDLCEHGREREVTECVCKHEYVRLMAGLACALPLRRANRGATRRARPLRRASPPHARGDGAARRLVGQ